MKLSEYQAAEGLSLTQLAGRLGFAVSTVHGWVAGDRSPGMGALPVIVARTDGRVSVVDLRPELAAPTPHPQVPA